MTTSALVAAPNTETTPPPSPPSLSIGAFLRQMREQKHITVTEVAMQTRFTTKKIQSLENEEWSTLPQGAQLRALIRAIGKTISLTEQDLQPYLDQLSTANVNQLPTAAPIGTSMDQPQRIKQASFWWTSILPLVLFVLLVLAIVEYLAQQQ